MSSKIILHEHPNLIGQHALFSPSQSAWLRYDNDQIAERVVNQNRNFLGTEIHEFAAQQITLNIRVTNNRALKNSIVNFIYTKYKALSTDGKLPVFAEKLIKSVRYIHNDVLCAIRSYINDGIGFKMDVEWPIYYSDYCFGTADSLVLRDNCLHIHDLKTGITPAHPEQLMVYAALYCLEYGPENGFKPQDIVYDLRMYKCDYDDYVLRMTPTSEDIIPIMDRIIKTTKVASKVDKEA